MSLLSNRPITVLCFENKEEWVPWRTHKHYTRHHFTLTDRRTHSSPTYLPTATSVFFVVDVSSSRRWWRRRYVTKSRLSSNNHWFHYHEGDILLSFTGLFPRRYFQLFTTIKTLRSYVCGAGYRMLQVTAVVGWPDFWFVEDPVIKGSFNSNMTSIPFCACTHVTSKMYPRPRVLARVFSSATALHKSLPQTDWHVVSQLRRA
jgi:hypothetical protein